MINNTAILSFHELMNSLAYNEPRPVLCQARGRRADQHTSSDPLILLHIAVDTIPPFFRETFDVTDINFIEVAVQSKSIAFISALLFNVSAMNL